MSRHEMPRPNLLVGVLLAMTLSRPHVEVTGAAVVVRLGWAFRAAVPRASVDSVASVPRSGLSIGAHGWRGRWLVNTATRPLVRLTIAPSAPGRILGVPIRIRELTVSIADVDAFLADLR